MTDGTNTSSESPDVMSRSHLERHRRYQMPTYAAHTTSGTPSRPLHRYPGGVAARLPPLATLKTHGHANTRDEFATQFPCCKIVRNVFSFKQTHHGLRRYVRVKGRRFALVLSFYNNIITVLVVLGHGKMLVQRFKQFPSRRLLKGDTFILRLGLHRKLYRAVLPVGLLW